MALDEEGPVDQSPGPLGTSTSKSRKLPTKVTATRRSTRADRPPRTAQPRPVEKSKDPVVVKRLAVAKDKLARWQNVAFHAPNGKPRGEVRDRLVAMVRDPFWLHAYWELTRAGVERAEAAMGQDWHAARPVLRLFEVSASGTTTASEGLSGRSKSTAASITGISMSWIRQRVPARNRLPRGWRQVLRSGPQQRRQHPRPGDQRRD